MSSPILLYLYCASKKIQELYYAWIQAPFNRNNQAKNKLTGVWKDREDLRWKNCANYFLCNLCTFDVRFRNVSATKLVATVSEMSNNCNCNANSGLICSSSFQFRVVQRRVSVVLGLAFWTVPARGLWRWLSSSSLCSWYAGRLTTSSPYGEYNC